MLAKQAAGSSLLVWGLVQDVFVVLVQSMTMNLVGVRFRAGHWPLVTAWQAVNQVAADTCSCMYYWGGLMG